MKKVTELNKKELFHIAKLVNPNYAANFDTFEVASKEGIIIFGAAKCMFIKIDHEEGTLVDISNRSKENHYPQWGCITSTIENKVLNYLTMLVDLEQTYDFNTKISINDSIKMLKVALFENVVFSEDEDDEDLLLDVVDSYKKQLNLEYGK